MHNCETDEPNHTKRHVTRLK